MRHATIFAWKLKSILEYFNISMLSLDTSLSGNDTQFIKMSQTALKVVYVPVEVNHQMSHVHVCRALQFKKIDICIA